MNAPHRVENLDTFSVSMTISYTNTEIRRAEIVNLANGLLRHRFGYAPKTRNLRGPSSSPRPCCRNCTVRASG